MDVINMTTAIEVVAVGVVGVIAGLLGFVVMARRAGIIPDPEKQSKLNEEVSQALALSKRAIKEIEAHETDERARHEKMHLLLGAIRDRLGRIEGQLSSKQ